MFKKVLAVAMVASFVGMPALAGNLSLENANGMKIKIHCTGGGCKVSGKKAGDKKWGTVERTKGGTKNYLKLEEKYKGMGFN